MIVCAADFRIKQAMFTDGEYPNLRVETSALRRSLPKSSLLASSLLELSLLIEVCRRKSQTIQQTQYLLRAILLIYRLTSNLRALNLRTLRRHRGEGLNDVKLVSNFPCAVS